MGRRNRQVLAIRVWEVKSFEPSGSGVASVMYTELRSAHPAFVVGADNQLTGQGRDLVRHYREKYPDVHVGRFDVTHVLHRTSGPDDPIYEPERLAPEA